MSAIGGAVRSRDVRSIRQPTPVVNGVHDEMIPVENSYWSSQNLPNAVLLSASTADAQSLGDALQPRTPALGFGPGVPDPPRLRPCRYRLLGIGSMTFANPALEPVTVSD